MDDQKRKSSRRAFLQRISFAAAAGSLLASCRSETQAGAAAMNVATGERAEFSCTDVSKLTEQQTQTRKSLKYVDSSPDSDKRCNNCRFFEAPAGSKECGKCQVVPGPIHPKGYCTAWAATAG